MEYSSVRAEDSSVRAINSSVRVDAGKVRAIHSSVKARLPRISLFDLQLTHDQSASAKYTIVNDNNAPQLAHVSRTLVLSPVL